MAAGVYMQLQWMITYQAKEMDGKALSANAGNHTVIQYDTYFL